MATIKLFTYSRLREVHDITKFNYKNCDKDDSFYSILNIRELRMHGVNSGIWFLSVEVLKIIKGKSFCPEILKRWSL